MKLSASSNVREPIRVLLTGAGGAASRNVAASLRLASQNYWLLGVDRNRYYLDSSGCNEVAVVPSCTEQEFIPALIDLVDRHHIVMIHPQPDPEVCALSNISAGVLPVDVPPPEVIELTQDKARTAELLDASGVAVPFSCAVTDPAADWKVTASAGGGVVWVRARHGAGARASLPTSNADEALAWMDYWERRGIGVGDFMFSEFLPGREYAVQTLWWKGELVAAQGRERLEYLFGFLSPSGQSSSPSVARICNRSDIYETALDATRAIMPRPHGIFSIDLKCDIDDKPRLTEINAGRFFTTSLFLATLGINFPDIWLQMRAGERVDFPGQGPVSEGAGLWIRSVDMLPALIPE